VLYHLGSVSMDIVVYVWFMCGLCVVYVWFMCGLCVVYVGFMCGLCGVLLVFYGVLY
jgi:hypothetical protein